MEEKQQNGGKSCISNATTNRTARLLKDGKSIFHMLELHNEICNSNSIFIDGRKIL